MPSVTEAELDDSGETSLISLAEVSEVVQRLLSGKVPGVDEIHLEMDAEGSGHCWTVMADTPLQCHMEVGDRVCGLAHRDGGSHF